jgi:WD40 repeat protein
VHVVCFNSNVEAGCQKQVNGLSFKQGTHLLATASDDTTSMIWDAEKGICVTSLKVRC